MKNAWMDEALDLARQGLGRTSPNPAVGAVIVKDGEVVGHGFHIYARKQHAEIVALDEAGARARESTVYVTLEPCSFEGRTPPCADALVNAGVARVVAAMEDPNPRVAGQGFRRLREAGIPVDVATDYSDPAAQLHHPYTHFIPTPLPLSPLKTTPS